MNVIRHHLLRQGRTTSLLFQNVQKCKLVTTKRNYSSSPRKIGQPIPETHPHLLKPNELTKGIHRDEFKRRRERYVAKMAANSVAVFFSGPEKIMTANIPYENHHNTQVSYLSGFQETNAILVLEKHSQGHTFTMFVRKRDPSREIWNGPTAGVESMVPIFGCNKAYPLDLAKDILEPILSRASIIYHTKKVWDEMTKTLQLDTQYEGKVQNDLLLQELRLVKSKAEIELMKTAGIINSESFNEAIKFTKPGMIEWMVTARIEYESKMRGAQRLAYPPVSAGGSNGLSMHYVQNTDILREGEMILVDAGCEYHGYCSDITRVWPVGKKFSPSQRAVYEAVLDCNKKCIEMATTESSIGALQGHANQILFENLATIGVLPKRGWASHTLFKNIYPHNLGHYLGMDLHDCNDITNHKRLQPGTVITVEPGVYIAPHPYIPECFHNIAIRIEDDIVITEGQPIVLTSIVPKEVSEIEALRHY